MGNADAVALSRHDLKLAEPLQSLPPFERAFAYGSAVFPQPGAPSGAAVRDPQATG